MESEGKEQNGYEAVYRTTEIRGMTKGLEGVIGRVIREGQRRSKKDVGP